MNKIKQIIRECLNEEKNNTNLTLYHGSNDNKEFKRFDDYQFYTVNDYIACNYAENNGGLLYKVSVNNLNSLELKGNYYGMDKREPELYKFEYNLIKNLYGDDELNYWINRGFTPSPAYTFRGNWDPIIKWAKNNGFNSLKFRDESFDTFVKDDTYLIFDGNNIKILDVAEPNC